MCGIFGFVRTTADPSSVVIEGLKDLEYRGYDSWGVAVVGEDRVLVEKAVGKIGSASSSLPPSKSALGHTRWATHGGVTHANAHPHTDCHGRLALIHNGIVENYADMKAQLGQHDFDSETDSEVAVHFIEDELSRQNGNGTVASALMSVFQRFAGLSAFAILDGQTGEIAAIKNGSPLVVGVAHDGCYLASDPVALIRHTRDLIFVEDGQAVRLTSSGPEVYDALSGRRVEPEIRTVDWEIHSRDLGPFEHYMIKEINEQPQVLRNLAGNAAESIAELAEMIRQASSVVVTGCGTAYNAALAGQYLFARIAGHRVTAVMASEMDSAVPLLDEKSLVIALSQSGETIDVLDAVRVARDRGAKVAALTNSEGSTLYRFSDLSILLECGPERCVLSTKTYLAKVAILTMAANALAGDLERGRRVVAEGAMLIETKLVEEADHGTMASVASDMVGSHNIFPLGRSIAYPLALEAALKIKEVSYIHAEGFASGELKHGVIALIEPGTPCLIFAIEPETLKATLAGASEVKARGALTIGFSRENHPEFSTHVPIHREDDSALFEVAVCFQLLAYQLAVKLGRDPDKPRNLAKSVTVR